MRCWNAMAGRGMEIVPIAENRQLQSVAWIVTVEVFYAGTVSSQVTSICHFTGWRLGMADAFFLHRYSTKGLFCMWGMRAEFVQGTLRRRTVGKMRIRMGRRANSQLFLMSLLSSLRTLIPRSHRRSKLSLWLTRGEYFITVLPGVTAIVTQIILWCSFKTTFSPPASFAPKQSSHSMSWMIFTWIPWNVRLRPTITIVNSVDWHPTHFPTMFLWVLSFFPLDWVLMLFRIATGN